MTGWLSAPWAKLQAALAIAGAALVAIGIAFLKGRRAGIAHIEAEQNARRIKSVEQRNAAADQVAGLGAQDVDRNLARWNREN